MDYQQIFQQRLSNLNQEQKQAVLTTEGPVLVVAGPGAGKTELLSLRVANILKTTDTPASSILCITFTDAAAANMRERLISIIGPEASKVVIHTFHSFGTEIINRYPEYFFEGAQMTPLDELQKMQLCTQIIKKFPITATITKKHPEQGYTYLRDAMQITSFLKQAGLTYEQFTQTLQQNRQEITQINKLIATHLAELTRISKKTKPQFITLLQDLALLKKHDLPHRYYLVLDQALQRADFEDSTKPLTEFKNTFLHKNPETDLFELKSTSKQDLLQEIAEFYRYYQEQLLESGQFDFDDMLLTVLKALQTIPDLKSELQERYLYVQIDEFQDTNGVQMQLVNELITNPLTEGAPNICAVGDDDQSVYKFQGANLDNILSFKEQYPAAQIITLTKNYRSTAKIIEYMLPVIRAAEIRLESVLPEVQKDLTAGREHHQSSEITLHQAPSVETEQIHIAKSIQLQLQNGILPQDIAVITRTHRELKELVHHLQSRQIPISYERKANLLQEPIIALIILILKQVYYLSSQAPRFDQSYLPMILSHEAMQVPAHVMWQLSLQAKQKRVGWFELMLETTDPHLSRIARLISILAQKSEIYSVRRLLLDLISSGQDEDHQPHEPQLDQQDLKQNDQIPNLIHQFYSKQSGEAKLRLIQKLHTVMNFVEGLNSDKQIMLKDCINYLELLEEYKIPVSFTENIGSTKTGVNLLTAHKSKGLEFNTVYILNATEQNWFKSKQMNKVKLPLNLPFLPQQDTLDDSIRLLFVALSRAKYNIHLSWSVQTASGRKATPIALLTSTGADLPITEIPPRSASEIMSQEALSTTEANFVSIPPKATAKELLRNRFEYYKLSPSHLVSYLDILYSGPQNFFKQTLLGYPEPMSIHAVYGSAMHKALEVLQAELRKTTTIPAKEYLEFYFKTALQKAPLTEQEYENVYQTGAKQLQLYYQRLRHTFSAEDLPEQNFSSKNVMINGAKVTGKLDKLAITQDTVKVIDYKTGTPLSDFTAVKNRYKAWKFKLQLGMYYLLLQNSATTFSHNKSITTAIHFLDAKEDQSIEINYTPSQTELAEVAELIGIIYTKITDLEFPDTEQYPKTFSGIQQFIADLKAGLI